MRISIDAIIITRKGPPAKPAGPSPIASELQWWYRAHMHQERKNGGVRKVSRHQEHIVSILKSHGLKATRGRIAILELLRQSATPRTAAHLHSALKGALDKVTVYRTLDVLLASGLVAKVDLQHAHAHYELIAGRAHHHHIICGQCGAIEDVRECADRTLERSVLRRSAHFAEIERHSMEFFGTCKKCV